MYLLGDCNCTMAFPDILRVIMAEILLADDDRAARNSFKALLESEGHVVTLAKNGEEVVACFQAHRPDLVLLDVMMPKQNGIVTCAALREMDALVPIIFFTAMPSDVSLVRGLGMGADDYIAKDRSPEEFIARVHAALRRRAASEMAASPKEIISLGSVTVNFRTMSVRDGDAAPVPLTKCEALILKELNRQRGCYVDSATLYTAAHGEGYAWDPQSVRSFISHLKKKLGRASDMIKMAYNGGYMLIR